MDAKSFLICALTTLRDWQTLAGSLLALGAAYWTVRTMKSQMRQDVCRHRKAEERKKYATRAQLPDALSELSAHVKAVVREILAGNPPPEKSPVEAMNTLKLAIEHVDDEAASGLFKLVSWYQVWNARMHGSYLEMKGNLITPIYDSAKLQAYILNMFDYARNEAEIVVLREPNEGEMITALKNVVGLVKYTKEKEKFSGVLTQIERLHGEAKVGT